LKKHELFQVENLMKSWKRVAIILESMKTKWPF